MQRGGLATQGLERGSCATHSRFKKTAQGTHLVSIVHCVGLHVINGAGGDGRRGHDIDLHIVGVMEVMPQCLQLWEVCTTQKPLLQKYFVCGKPLRPRSSPSSALHIRGFRIEPAFWDANE